MNDKLTIDFFFRSIAPHLLFIYDISFERYLERVDISRALTLSRYMPQSHHPNSMSLAYYCEWMEREYVRCAGKIEALVVPFMAGPKYCTMSHTNRMQEKAFCFWLNVKGWVKCTQDTFMPIYSCVSNLNQINGLKLSFENVNYSPHSLVTWQAKLLWM